MKLMLIAVAAGVSFLLCTTGIAAVMNNDNTRPAGEPRANVVVIDMVADSGTWRPEGSNGVALDIAAFGEEGGALSVPGPLIRVRAGSTIALRLRNRIAQDLHVHGLCSRPGKCAEVSIPAGGSRELRFELNAPGTYYYWASTGAARPGLRSRFESQLNGAIVVDPREQAPPDRVFVISTYDDPLPISADDPRILGVPTPGIPRVFAINGASWPHTERLSYPVDRTVHWRMINLGNIGHAMHLHGYYFQVEARGDGISDDAYRAEQRITEVTEVIGPARTFAMSWLPTRPGNWLFHCHMTEHMSASDAHAHSLSEHGGAAGMAGLVLGIRVTGPPVASAPATTRQLRMMLTEEANRYGNRPGYRVAVQGDAAPKLDEGSVPGPVLVLHRGEPVEIEVVNRLSEPTAIHWHGLELDSYYDGVPGYAGDGDHLAPAIAPGQSFIARFTPPRAGTFIYHTHWHDDAQLAGGLYGPLLVLEPGEQYDPAVDHIVVIGLSGVLVEGGREPFALNGRDPPAPIHMRAGVVNRLRLINITPNNSILNILLLDRFEPATWKLIAKDGATVPRDQSKPTFARQLVSVGETYDFEVVPTAQQNLWLEVRRGNGEWVLQAPAVVH